RGVPSCSKGENDDVGYLNSLPMVKGKRPSQPRRQMKRKSNTAAKKLPRASKVTKKGKVGPASVRSVPADTAAANQDMLIAAVKELVRIGGDMRDLLAEIRNLLAEGAEQQGGTQEERAAGVEAVIIAESEGEEDEEDVE